MYGSLKNTHFGNPFGVTTELFNVDTGATIKNAGTAEEVTELYTNWIKGLTNTDIEKERREWIVSQIKEGKLDNKTLLYYKDSEINHAKALANLVNDKSWLNKPTNAINAIVELKKQENLKPPSGTLNNNVDKISENKNDKNDKNTTTTNDETKKIPIDLNRLERLLMGRDAVLNDDTYENEIDGDGVNEDELDTVEKVAKSMTEKDIMECTK